MPTELDPQALAEEVLKAKNFQGMDPALVLRVTKRELQNSNNPKEIVKNVKSKLYQVGGAYRIERKRPESLLTAMDEFQLQDQEMLKSRCRELMNMHVSTRERLPHLDDFYGEIFSRLPRIGSVLDLACGFNPFAIPWMPLQENFVYDACDVYEDMVRLINAFFAAMGIQGGARQLDLIDSYPESQAKLTLLLKTIPCLEQLDKAAGRQLLSRISSPFAVVSFPALSIGGRAKGMPRNYEAHFLEIVDPDVWQFKKLPISYELVFLLERK